MRTAKQWSMTAPGPQDFRIREAEIAEPAAGEVLVRTEAVSLNFRDKLVLETGMDLPLKFPFVPASDMAGVVEAVGSGVTRFKRGDRVISTFSPGRIEGGGLGDARHPPYKTLGGYFPGVLSEYVTFPEDWFVAAPATLDAAEASTLPCAGLTAWFALIEAGRLKAGDKVVIQGTGGVALFGLQIAKAHGAEVFITSSSPAKLERARSLGADHLLPRDGWVERVHEITGDYGADHILEIAGGPGLANSLQAVAVGGRISVIGVFEGFDVSGPALPLLLKAPTIQGISVGHRRALEDFVRGVDAAGLKPVIDRRYRFEEAAEAFAHLDRGAFGKIVIEF
ncbi:NAD(P)-dependent alcohol dehydrogenase [Neorhizobium sp. CSC1952]|uniref:NADPH:quinone reductase n=1 Tax=Xaviernesmea oryzae TaxID=464029 RepID=A0A1X7CTQ0_9HYPH|nr:MULTISPECIES: NAD(P)-dependent alcohol dehydrogenase [Rhizobium/Agrobacterium group]WJR65792.1 NAD(P)-dependent alcohol dehydrogenase [Rhizobium sp. CSC1952]SMF02671.1 NADPH:quinone reductase [Xaviernesmea oryzae]